MSFSIKTSAIGIGITAGALFMIHNRFESDADLRQNKYETLVGCASDLGQTGCLEAVELYNEDLNPDFSTETNKVTFTYNPEAIVELAEEILEDDEDGFQYFIYPATVISGLALTIGFQNRKMRRALAGQYY